MPKAKKSSPTVAQPEDVAAALGKPSRSVFSTSLQPAVGVPIMLLAGAASTISQLNLSPVFGSIPAARYHMLGILYTFLLAIFLGPPLRGLTTGRLRREMTLVAWFIPPIQHYLYRLSGPVGPVYGPMLTELCTYYPLLLLSLLTADKFFTKIRVAGVNKSIAQFMPHILSLILWGIGKQIADSMLPLMVGQSALLGRAGLQLATAAGYTACGLFQMPLSSLLPIVWIVAMDPHLYSSRASTVLHESLKAHNYTLLERRESLTGYISVLESHENEFRVLRCDHSLLGGDWLVTERSRKRGLRKRETVYSVFTMLESVRLVERPNAAVARESSSISKQTALVIGLGIGTSPKAFVEHGINTTIVELDPVIYDFAVKYFDLPRSSGNRPYLEDAIPFVAEFSKSEPNSYDYIVHDVFTGGAEPTGLFTLEFLQGLEKLLKDDGVIAINYAADLTLPVPKIVVRTILEVFPTCRIFRDTPAEEAGSGNSFVNMIVFCTKQYASAVKFRKAVEADWLGSLARRQWIPPKDSLEMPVTQFLAPEEMEDQTLLLSKGEEQKLEKYHQASAEKHWRIMRTVLPDAVWELW